MGSPGPEFDVRLTLSVYLMACMGNQGDSIVSVVMTLLNNRQCQPKPKIRKNRVTQDLVHLSYTIIIVHYNEPDSNGGR